MSTFGLKIRTNTLSSEHIVLYLLITVLFSEKIHLY